jgi:hypothetical protein
MRWVKLLAVLWFLAALAARADSARIVKALPHYLDQKGHYALKPSLYERDAYQAYLRHHPALVSAIRFDVQWKGGLTEGLKLRVEARGNKDGEVRQATVEAPVRKGGLFEHWTSATIEGEAYRQLGQLTAWRVTFWSAGQQVAEQKSYLW